VLFGVVDLAWISKTSVQDLAYIFVHEVSRSCLDRLTNENLKEKAFRDLIGITCEVFGLESKHLY
jgi:hypothetical protein